jgi:hypothetical protein
MAFLVVMGLCLAAAVYADGLAEDYQGVYNDEEKVSGTASVTVGASSLNIGGNAVQGVSAEGGGKIKFGAMSLGSWDYVYYKGADGKAVKIGLVLRIKAGPYNKAMLGLGRQFAEKLYADHQGQFKFDSDAILTDIPADLEWAFFGTKR